MTRKTTDVGGHTARSNKGIARLNNVYQTDTVQAQLEAAAEAGDEVAALVTRLQVAQTFDDVEAREGQRAALPGFFNHATDEYALEGPGSSAEWMVADLDSIALTEEWR